MAFLLIMVISFSVMVSSMTGMVSSYLYNQRIRQDSLSVEKLASAFAPFFERADADALSEALRNSGGEMGGRLLIVDRVGKVQADSFGTLQGVRLELPEVISILADGRGSAYGVHGVNGESSPLFTLGGEMQHVAYCTAALVSSAGETIGALLFVSPIEELVASLSAVLAQMITVFLLVAAAAVAMAQFFARIVTKPVSALTHTIKKMGQGDLSVRVPVRGSGELRELAVSYNTMAQQLESLDKSRNQFVSNASHELKTPLTTMKILLENMLYQPDMPQELREEFMQDINHEIDRLSSVVTDLLTLTQMDNHRMELQRTTVSLTELCEETLRKLQPIAEQRRHTIVSRIAEGVTGEVDASKLLQVMYNLTDNAIKYTPDGGTITVTLSQTATQAVFSVKDTGMGISEEDLTHIFDRFYRVDKARSRESGGTGLGLSIVRQLVTLHGGQITVDSTPGHGSTFTVTLPIPQKAGDDA